METVTLAVRKREKKGSAFSRNMRRAGKVPAVVYGHGSEPLSLEIDQKELFHVLHTKAGENVVVDLKLEGAALKESTCQVKDIQHHPVTDEIQHVDFTIISLTEKIEVEVNFHAIHADECIGVKEGGVLDIVHHEIPIECLPTEIPERIDFDVKELKIGDSVHVKDLNIPSNIKCLLELEEVVVAIHAPRVEEEPVADEVAEGPEVIEKGKKKEEGEGDAKEAAEKPAAAEKKAEKK